MSSLMMKMNGEEEEEEERKRSYLKSFPLGFQFNPTDEQLIVDYLKKKIKKDPLPINQFKYVNLYDQDPWELTENFTSYGENEYYYFTPRNRKYAKGPRAKRVARNGYWKSSGQVIPIYDTNGVEIGSKKVLVFYKGKRSNREKTPWVMLEYRAENEDAENTTDNGTATRAAVTRSATGGDKQVDEWVLCKIYKRVEEEPAATPAPQETQAVAAAPTLEAASAASTLEAASAAPATLAAAENHLNIMEAENTITYTYPGSDIYFDQDMIYFWRSNKVVGKIFKRAEEEPAEAEATSAAAPIEYKEESNDNEDMFKVEEYLVFPDEGIDSSESPDP